MGPPEGAVGELNDAAVALGDVEHSLAARRPDKLPVGNEQTRRLRLLHENRRHCPVSGDPEEVAVGSAADAARAIVEAVADLGPVAEGIDHHLPVATADLEGDEVLLKVGHQHRGSLARRRVGLPAASPSIGVEVHVLDAPDVRALVHADPDVERAAVDIPDVMHLVMVGTEVDGAVGVGEGAVYHVEVGARPLYSPRVRLDVLHSLLGVEDRESLESCTLAQHELGRTIFLSAAPVDIDDCSEVQR